MGQQYAGQPDDFEGSSECSFVEMDVDELYSIRVVQYYNLKIIIP